MRLLPALASFTLLTALSGCSVSDLWPFGSSDAELSRAPRNATEYKCDAGKAFWIRTLPDNAIWLIAPDREIRLEKLKSGTASYGVGRIVLDLGGDTASLFDPPATFSGCKRAAKTS